MRHEVLWKRRQHGRHIVVVRQANRHHYPARGNDLSIFKANSEAFRGSPERVHELVLQFRHKSPLELQAVGSKYLERDRKAYLGVGNALLLTVGLKGVSGTRVIKGGCKTLGFEPHAFGHVRQPGVHRIPENTKVDAARLEMRRDRQSIRPCTDDRYFTLCHLLCHPPVCPYVPQLPTRSLL